MDITQLLERAVADVTPAERRPADAVLRLAEGRRLGSRVRKALAGLVGVAVIGGGAVVVATGGQDDPDRDQTPAPRPIGLTVDIPDGWSAVEESRVIDCTTQLAPRTVYRDALIGELGSCLPEQGITVDGPVLLVGHLTDPGVADQIRTSGTPVEAAGTTGWAVSFDAPFSYIVWLPAGAPGELAYAALAPRSEDDVRAYEDPLGYGTGSLPQELVDLVGTVTATGELPTDVVLPDTVAAVDLHVESANRGDGVGARILDPTAVEQVMATLDPPRSAAGCGPTQTARILHLQDAGTHRWVRVDVLDDGAGCRTIYSELGGSRQVSGDPVAVAAGLAEPQVATFGAAASTVQEHGLSVGVPEGWEVVRGRSVDPCTLAGPAVVVADALAPSCSAAQYARPTHPFVWVTSTRVEGMRIYTDDRTVVPVDGSSPAASVRWTEVTLQMVRTTLTGLLGRPATGEGRLFVVGLDQQGSLPLRQSVEPG